MPAVVDGTLRIELLDLLGRKVRVLQDAPVIGGTREWTWDRRDEQGQRVAPGFYLLRIVGPGIDELQRVYVAP